MAPTFYNVSRVFVRTLFRICFGLKVTGQENIPASGPLIVSPNHASYLDPPMVGCLVHNRPLWYMARASLFSNPLFATLIRWTNAFPVKRGSADRMAWKAFEDHVASGHGVLFFPEGTRSTDGKLQEAKPGSGMLIYRCSGARVLPVRIFGADKAWPKGGWPRLARVRVAFGPVLDFEAERSMPPQRETYERIAQKVMQAIAKLQDPLEPPHLDPA
jgi:1-acyl-sn-glycerol-3-phosphate acyltransferase